MTGTCPRRYQLDPAGTEGAVWVGCPDWLEGVDAARIAEHIRRVVELLSGEDAQWVGTTEAKRLLGVSSENTVKAWARLGLLRSRTLPNRRVQVLLDDVLFPGALVRSQRLPRR